MNTTIGLATALVCAVSFCSPVSAADDYPVRPVRILVGYAAGGTTDQIARRFGEKISKYIGQPVIIDNKPGAGGNVAIQNLIAAGADGYTVALGANYVSVNAAFDKNPYDWRRDTAPISLIASVPNIVVVPAASPYKTIQDFIAATRKPESEGLSYGSAGIGSSSHMAGELYNGMVGSRMTHVPYKGAPAAEIDLAAGLINVMFDNITTAVPMVNAGKLRPLALTGPRRLSSMAQLPTLHESGLEGFSVEATYFLVASAKAPRNVVAKLSEAVGQAGRDKDIQAFLESIYARPWPAGPAAATDFLEKDELKWRELRKSTGMRIE